MKIKPTVALPCFERQLLFEIESYDITLLKSLSNGLTLDEIPQISKVQELFQMEVAV
jgi:hypothetical protein